MGALDILTTEFLAELPDDPQMAFVKLIGYVDHYIDQAMREDYASIYGTMARLLGKPSRVAAAQRSAISAVRALAKRFGIEPFASLAQPPLRNEDFSTYYFQFKAELDDYVLQFALNNRIGDKRDITIESNVKDRIRQHIHGIKTLIDRADILESQRAVLHKRIADFEAALDKSRVSVVALAVALVAILAAVANVSQLADSPAMGKLVATIMAAIGQAKASDEAKRELPVAEPPHARLPQRPREAGAEPERALDDETGSSRGLIAGTPGHAVQIHRGARGRRAPRPDGGIP